MAKTLSKEKVNIRQPKTIYAQYEIYCAFMETHPEMARKKDSDLTIDGLWTELTTLLNSTGHGPVKEKKQWQKTFENWRNTVRCKKRKEMTYSSKTDSDTDKPISLKAIELRALQIWGDVVIQSLMDEEIKFETSSTSKCEMDTFEENITSAFPLSSPNASIPQFELLEERIKRKRKKSKNKRAQLGSIIEIEKKKLSEIVAGRQTCTNELRRLADAEEAKLKELSEMTKAFNAIAQAMQSVATALGNYMTKENK